LPRGLPQRRVYSADKESPNYTYSQATPQASMRLVITNPEAFEQFEPLKIYDVVFTPHEEPKA
jgi:hypothetical protein